MLFQTVYWDACVFHALFSADGSEAERLDACNKIHKAATEGLIQIYTSTLTFVECVWIKGIPKKLTKEHETAIQKYFAHKFIKPVIGDRTISEAARVHVWQYGVHPKDAVHVASAAFAGVDVMHTYDDALIRLSGKIPCGQGTLRIEKPTDPNPPPPAPPKQAEPAKQVPAKAVLTADDAPAKAPAKEAPAKAVAPQPEEDEGDKELDNLIEQFENPPPPTTPPPTDTDAKKGK